MEAVIARGRHRHLRAGDGQGAAHHPRPAGPRHGLRRGQRLHALGARGLRPSGPLSPVRQASSTMRHPPATGCSCPPWSVRDAAALSVTEHAMLDIDLDSAPGAALLAALAERHGDALARVSRLPTRLFLLRSPAAPGLRFVGGEADPARTCNLTAYQGGPF